MLRLTSAMVATILAAAPVFADPDHVITVNGSGEVNLAPDMARISIGITAEAPTAGEAMALMSTDSRNVLDHLLADEQLESADVQTGQLSLYPRYGEAKPGQASPLVGFSASTTVDIRVRDLTRLGGLLDAVVTEGANGLNGLSFDIKDRKTAMNEAHRAAVADARARAELYAEAAGVALGPVVSISETGGYGAPAPMMMSEMARSGSVPIAGGEMTIEAGVTMVFELVEAPANAE